MMYPVTYRAEHIQSLVVQSAQEGIRVHLPDTMMRQLENEHAYTLMRDGQPVVCCGAIEVWANRAYVWSFLGDIATREFREVHSWAKRFLNGLPFRRLEATVDIDFEPGHRWVKSLGFECEAPRMKAFQVDGRDGALYALVRN